MSLHRSKAAIIGLLEANRANEWVVTEKLGNTMKQKYNVKASKKPKSHMRERYMPEKIFLSHLHNFAIFIRLKRFHQYSSDEAVLSLFCRIQILELMVGTYLLHCAIYNILFGHNHFFIYLLLQAGAFFIVGIGYVGTFVTN